MYKIGDYVVSANNGVCKIEDVVVMDMPKGLPGKECYMVIPLQENSVRLYVPVNSKKHQIRPAMSRQEALDVINEIGTIEETWVESDKLREQIYKDAIFSCDPRRLVSILKTMHIRSRARVAEGKKITTIDERYFRIAEKNLHGELAFVLNKDVSEVRDIIMKKVEAAERKR